MASQIATGNQPLWVCTCVLSCLTFATPWTVVHQAPLSMGFPRQEYWSGLPFPSPGDHPYPGIEPKSPESPVLPGGFFNTWEAVNLKGGLSLNYSRDVGWGYSC